MAAHMAPRATRSRHQSLHHFVADSPWLDQKMLRRVAQWVVPAMDFSDGGWWIVDDTGFAKQGHHWVGLARQYCCMLGKQDHCPVAVSVSLACQAGSLPVAWQLYLPMEWADEPARREKAGAPKEQQFSTSGVGPDVGSSLLARPGSLAAAAGPLAVNVAVHENSAGTMPSRSPISSPMRVIGRPQPRSRQSVCAGSWRCSTRRRCSGNGLRRSRRGGAFVVVYEATGAAPAAASRRSRSNCARRPASSSASVSSNRRRCSAFIGLGLGAELPAFEPGQLEGDLLDLGPRRAISRSLRQQRVALGERSVALRQGTAMVGQLLVLGLQTSSTNGRRN